jgi:hypothetical protein
MYMILTAIMKPDSSSPYNKIPLLDIMLNQLKATNNFPRLLSVVVAQAV